ncbi:DUF3099 domain-containing protein [Jatrophihabitans sp. DSM 45814]
MRALKRHSDKPVLITAASTSGDDSFDQRRRRYLITMTIRALCIVGAATTVHLSGWLAAGFVGGALVLPWTAVLIANDRPPKQGAQFRRFVPGLNHDGPRQLEGPPISTAEANDPADSKSSDDTGQPDTGPTPTEGSKATVIDI